MSWLRSTRRAQRWGALQLETLGDRIVPYTTSGNAWPSSQLVTISFVPDGTIIANNGSQPVGSNLFATFNAKFGSPAVWQPIFLRAAQSWAAATNLNFAVVADDGANMGYGEYQQGSPLHGDIRIGGYNFGNGNNLATAYMPPPVNNQDLAGEIKFNTALPFNNGTTYDLYAVAAHEFGHSLGLYHSNIAAATLFGAYNGVKNSLHSDDLAGIRAIYSGGAARAADGYDAAASNNTAATATDLTSLVDSAEYTAVVTGLDVTTSTDADWYVVGGAVPTSTGSLTVTARSQGLSLLAPTLTVYAADKTTVLGTATAGTNGYSANLSVTVSGVGAGSPVYIKVAAVSGSGFNTGVYALTLNTGTNPTPAVPLPNTTLANSLYPSLGGGTPLEPLLVEDVHYDTFHVNGDDHDGHGHESPAGIAAVVAGPTTPAAVAAPVAVAAVSPTAATSPMAVGFAQWMAPVTAVFQTAAAPVGLEVGTTATATFPPPAPIAADYYDGGWYYAGAGEAEAKALNDAWADYDDATAAVVVDDAETAGDWDAYAPVSVDGE